MSPFVSFKGTVAVSLSINATAMQAGLESAALFLIAQAPTSALVRASACRVTLVSVTQDSQVRAVVT